MAVLSSRVPSIYVCVTSIKSRYRTLESRAKDCASVAHDMRRSKNDVCSTFVHLGILTPSCTRDTGNLSLVVKVGETPVASRGSQPFPPPSLLGWSTALVPGRHYEGCAAVTTQAKAQAQSRLLCCGGLSAEGNAVYKNSLLSGEGRR